MDGVKTKGRGRPAKITKNGVPIPKKKLSWEEVKKLRRSEDGMFKVDRIQRKWVGKDGEVSYYVRWWGYPKTYNTWEPPSSFENCPDIIIEFENGRAMRSAARKNKQKEGMENVKGKKKRQNVFPNHLAKRIGSSVSIDPDKEGAEEQGSSEDPKGNSVGETNHERGVEERGEMNSFVILQTESISLEQYQRNARAKTDANPGGNECGGVSDVSTESVYYDCPEFIEAGDTGTSAYYEGCSWAVTEKDPVHDCSSSSAVSKDLPALDPELSFDEFLFRLDDSIPSLVLEQSPEDDLHIRILKPEEISSRPKMSPKFVGAAIIKNEFYYIAISQDDGRTVCFSSSVASKLFLADVSNLLSKIPLKFRDDQHCWLLRDGYCRLWGGDNDLKNLFAVKMHPDQQRFLIQPTGRLLCEDCLCSVESCL